jgi:hypothetical protein
MLEFLPSIIHLAADADFTNYVYTVVYAGANATPTINGTVVTMGAGSSFNINLNSISATANVYVMGNKANTYTGSVSL